MKAIVLTYDKYHQIADHMIHSYMRIWPDNPFVFRIPYQEFPAFIEEKYQNKVEFIKTDKNIKHSVLGLIDDLNDDEWIYWCMDDRYPIFLKIDEVSKIYRWITSLPVNGLAGMMFSKFPKMMSVKNIMPGNSTIVDEWGNKYYRRKNYAMIWMHQFLRVKVIRNLFNHFPDDFRQAKQMDYFKQDLHLPEEHKLYMYSKRTATYGESTHRSKMTRNCAESFRKFGMEIPQDIDIIDKQILIPNRNLQFSNIKHHILHVIYRFLLMINLVAYRSETQK